MRVALYDLLPLDDLPRYRSLADVTTHNRFRPAPDDVDLVLVTHTRIPKRTVAPVVLVGTALEVVRHLSGPVYRAPHWSAHAVAHYAVEHLLADGDRIRPVLVVGVGRIAALLRRWCRRYWPGGLARATSRSAGSIVLATPATDPPGSHDHALHRAGAGALLVSVARGQPVGPTLLADMLAGGHLARAVVDVGYRDVPGVIQTGHSAWLGHRSAQRRQSVVVQVIGLAATGRLTDLRRLATGGTAGLWG